MSETRVLTEAEFDAEFTLVHFPDGECVTTDQPLMATYPENRVWTLVDDGEGGLCLGSGFAVVNFIGWQVTEQPHPGGNGDIVVDLTERVTLKLRAVSKDPSGGDGVTLEERLPAPPSCEGVEDEDWVQDFIVDLFSEHFEDDVPYVVEVVESSAPELVPVGTRWDFGCD